MPRTSTVVGLRCPVPDCHGMLRDLKVGHAMNGAYTRRCRVCWVYCRGGAVVRFFRLPAPTHRG